MISLPSGVSRRVRHCIVFHLFLQPPHPLLRQMILPCLGPEASRLPHYGLFEFDLNLLALREPLLCTQGVLHLRLVDTASGYQRVAHYIYNLLIIIGYRIVFKLNH